MATLREVALMPRDLATVVPDVEPGDDVVVLVHGFMATAGVFRPLRRRLERDAHAHVATFTHAPGARVSAIAEKLGRLVERIPRKAHVHVVGHSLGGLVARWFVQELEGHARVAQTISLATPFGGVPVAGKIRVLVGADLHAASVLLTRVRARAHVGAVPHTSVVAGNDAMLVDPKSARFATGETIVLAGRGHNTLLFDEEVAGIVIERVKRHRTQRRARDL
jgi:triacylglycerol esterase/lipase EstA (alpha/beta hydrolase family)